MKISARDQLKATYRRLMRTGFAFALLLLATPVLAAEEPRGCDKFKWDITKPQQLLGLPSLAIPSLALNDRDDGLPFAAALIPVGKVKYEMPPERAPKNANSYGGFIDFGQSDKGGSYTITLAAAAWIDVIQNGKYLRPTASSGALDCPHVRKTVRFDIGPEPFVLQFSDVEADMLDLVILRD